LCFTAGHDRKHTCCGVIAHHLHLSTCHTTSRPQGIQGR
jgi:hypothetical protein